MLKCTYVFYKKILVCCLFLLFFCNNSCFAIDLNVEYPAISGNPLTGQSTIDEYLGYVFKFLMFLGFLIAFLSLTFAGILYLFSPLMPNLIVSAKDRISGTFSGLLILATVYLIITTINPSLAFFKTTPLKKVSVPTESPHDEGVYLFSKNDCPSSKPGFWDYDYYTTISVRDIKNSKNNVRSAKIVQGSSNKYIAILYDEVNFWGKCKYIDPNTSCEKNLEPFAASVSVYKYNYFPQDGSIVFYRKPFYDSSGGYFEIKGIQTKGIYVAKLSDLKFIDKAAQDGKNPEGCTVPKEERDCVSWDARGACTKLQCPFLGEKNVSSIKINGDYLVLLVYFDKDKPDPSKGPWSFCQAFPTLGDVNKKGPNKLDWENIRNLNNGKLPNYILIFPINNQIF